MDSHHIGDPNKITKSRESRAVKVILNKPSRKKHRDIRTIITEHSRQLEAEIGGDCMKSPWITEIKL
jgi:hypothetical protein